MQNPVSGISLSARTTALILVGIFFASLAMRLIMVEKTEVDIALRADAAQYYLYAANLREYGVYSLSDNIRDESRRSSPPLSDASRPPGYPLFLLPFIDYPPTGGMLRGVVVAQALISALSVVLAFLFFRSFLSASGSLVGAALTGLSPHLVAANVYVLSESLFTFFLTAFALGMSKVLQTDSNRWALAAGCLLGAVMLIRPTMDYFLLFLIPMLLTLMPWRQAAKIGALVVCGCSIVYGPWIIRNAVSVDEAALSTKALDSVHMGMYPNVMYEDDPETYGYPDRFDPEWSQRKDLASVLDALADRFSDEPGRHLRWYLVGKPIMFLSWNMVVGMGDVFIYPVFTSPYHESRLFFATHQLMYWIHWPIMALAALAAIMLWMPFVRGYLSQSQIRIGRFCSVLIAYFVAIHVVGLPLPRYAIPLRPVLFGAAILLISLVLAAAARRGRIPADDQALT